MTTPAGTVEEFTLKIFGLRPALSSSETAADSLTPLTGGTVTFGLPVEIVRSTLVRFATRTPGPGFWLITKSCATVSLGLRARRTRSPCARSSSAAFGSATFLTSSTATVELPPSVLMTWS